MIIAQPQFRTLRHREGREQEWRITNYETGSDPYATTDESGSTSLLGKNWAQTIRVVKDEADLRNLIDNAILVTEPQGRVEVSVCSGGAAVALAVVDTGCGIAPAGQQRVCERF